MLSNWRGNDLEKFILTDDISQKGVANDKGQNPKDAMLQDPFENLFCIPFLGFEFALFICVTIDEIFDFSKDHLHEDGLGAGPTTKEPSKNDSKQKYPYHKGQRGQYKNETVLGPEGHTQDDKFTFYNVEQEKWPTIYCDKRSTKHDSEKQI